MVVTELPPAPEPPRPKDRAPTVLFVLIVGYDVAVTEMLLLPPAVTPEFPTYADTVSLMVLSVRVTPTAKLTKPAASDTDTISADMVAVSSAETRTAPADSTLVES